MGEFRICRQLNEGNYLISAELEINSLKIQHILEYQSKDDNIVNDCQMYLTEKTAKKTLN